MNLTATQLAQIQHFFTDKPVKTAWVFGAFARGTASEAGDFVLVPMIGDQKIVLGGIKNLDNKFWRLKTFYKEAMTREGFNKYETINLKYRDQVVCRK